MKRNPKNHKKGIAILLALFLLVFLVVFAEVVWSYYISTILLQRRYENTLQNIYNLEAAKTACMWEVNHAASGWNTITNNVCQLQGAAITSKFYRLAGFNFRAQAIYAGGNTTIYAHAFSGTEANPRYSNYLEFIPVPSVTPLYQFVLFKNEDLYFPLPSYGRLLHCNGGKIHSNGDIGFGSYGFRFDQVMQLSAAGTIEYGGNDTPYPSPYDVDYMDKKIDGMAPAPYVNTPFYPGNHNYTTDGAGVNNAFDTSGLGYYLADPWWSPNAPAPPFMIGEESSFAGKQYWYTTNPSYGYHLTKDGEADWDIPVDQRATMHRFHLSDLSGSSLASPVFTDNGWNEDAVFFKPYQDSQEELNTDHWFEIPAALPETYTYTKYFKYHTDYGQYADQQPVNLYATERCASGAAGCAQDWRYIKTLSGATCADDACYNDAGSQYLKAQDYITSDGKPYYDISHINPYDYNKNNQFFEQGYSYGNDANDPDSPYRQIRALNVLQQPQGFQAYLSLLEQAGMSQDIIQAGVERKEMSLGTLFDETDGSGNVTAHSAYKNKAISGGLYIDCDNADTVIADLNAGGVEVAKKVTFYNWFTNLPTTLVDIDVGLMTEQNKNPANGIVYAKCIPIRLSNTESLPGTNNGDSRAVFTVISEESVYLKGDYNYDPDLNEEENESQRKLSNIATKKNVYTLSNAFNDPETSPDFAVFIDYPYMYVKKVDGQYVQEDGDPALGNGAWLSGQEDWISASAYTELRNWIQGIVDEKQTAYENSGINPPNRVDKSEYSYYSLFITPYEINDTLENWFYQEGSDYYRADKYVVGSILDLYADDPEHPEYLNYKAGLGNEENMQQDRRFHLDARGRQAHDSGYLSLWGRGLEGGWGGMGPSRLLEYDKLFPQITSDNPDATLAVAGGGPMAQLSIWRLVTENYFNSKIQ